MPVIETRSLFKDFTGGTADGVRALNNVSLQVERGEFLAICGPSGSGKTTLLNLIGGLDKPTSGQVFIDGQEVSNLSQQRLTQFRRKEIGFIFSDFNLIATLTASENIEYVLWLLGMSAAERRKRVSEAAERFGIGALLRRRPAQLSRGQQQRVAVARAIVHRPKVVLGDELTANLDRQTGIALMTFLQELNSNEGITFIFTTHDPAMIEQGRRILSMLDGQIIGATDGKH